MNRHIVAALLLLPIEGVLLGVMFDAQALTTFPTGWWSPIFWLIPRVLPIAAAIATAGFLLASREFREAFKACLQSLPSRRWTYGLVVLQLASFAVLAGVTSILFGGQLPRGALGYYVAGWLFTALLAAVLWVAAWAPAGLMSLLLTRGRAIVTVSVVCGVVAWAVGTYSQHGWRALKHVTLTAASFILRSVDRTAWVDPDRYLIGAGRLTVEVNEQCSGIEGIGLTCVSLAVWFALHRRRLRFPHVLLLLPAAALAVWLANALRIAVLVFLGGHVSREVALGGFHSYAGALLFSGVVLSVAWVANRSPFFCKEASLPAAGPNPVAPFLVPILSTTAAGLLTGLVSPDQDATLYPVVFAAGAAALWWYRREYAEIDWSPSWAGVVGGAVVFAVWIALAGAHPDPTYRSDRVSPAWQIPWTVCRVLGAVIVVPIAEELAFRGFLARRLMSADFDRVGLANLSWPAMIGSSIVFGVLHDAILAGIAAGVAYAWLARRRGRLGDAICAHAVTNALLAGYLVARGSVH